jgi:ketosteroid isomerase-like protein
MPRAKQKIATLGGSADDVEARFYDALQAGDVDKLMACWADEDDILCIHPGGPRLMGAGAIRAAYEAMLAQAGSMTLRPERLRKIESLTSVVHSVVERISIMTLQGPQDVFVIATNIYNKTAQGWRMVVHHVSPGSVQELEDHSATPPVLH